MKVTKKQLVEIISEEIEQALNERWKESGDSDTRARQRRLRKKMKADPDYLVRSRDPDYEKKQGLPNPDVRRSSVEDRPLAGDTDVSFTDKWVKGVFGMRDKKVDQAIKRFENIKWRLQNEEGGLHKNLETLEKARKQLMDTYDIRSKKGAVTDEDQRGDVTLIHNETVAFIQREKEHTAARKRQGPLGSN
jgi:hypothetical protein